MMLSKVKLVILLLMFIACKAIQPELTSSNLDQILSKLIKARYDSEDVVFKIQPSSSKLKATLQDNKQHIVVSGKDQSILGNGFLTIAQGCAANGCIVHNDDYNGAYEEFVVLTLYDLNNRIIGVDILDYASDYGYEITSKIWLKQFKNKEGKGLKLDKDIDGITGATVSIKALLNEMEEQHDLLNEILLTGK